MSPAPLFNRHPHLVQQNGTPLSSSESVSRSLRLFLYVGSKSSCCFFKDRGSLLATRAQSLYSFVEHQKPLATWPQPNASSLTSSHWLPGTLHCTSMGTVKVSQICQAHFGLQPSIQAASHLWNIISLHFLPGLILAIH